MLTNPPFGRGAYDVATFVNEAFPPQQRREVELDLLREYHSILEECGVSDYPFEECLYDYRLLNAGSPRLLDNHRGLLQL